MVLLKHFMANNHIINLVLFIETGCVCVGSFDFVASMLGLQAQLLHTLFASAMRRRTHP